MSNSFVKSVKSNIRFERMLNSRAVCMCGLCGCAEN